MDVLLILLNELDEVVDYFFIIESTRTHNQVTMTEESEGADPSDYRVRRGMRPN